MFPFSKRGTAIRYCFFLFFFSFNLGFLECVRILPISQKRTGGERRDEKLPIASGVSRDITVLAIYGHVGICNITIYITIRGQAGDKLLVLNRADGCRGANRRCLETRRVYAVTAANELH